VNEEKQFHKVKFTFLFTKLKSFRRSVLWLVDVNCIEYWELSSVSGNIAVAVLRVNMCWSVSPSCYVGQGVVGVLDVMGLIGGGFGFMYPQFLVSICMAKVSGFCIKKSTFSGGISVVALRFSCLAYSLQFRCIFL
jgi:hypothetical protein